LEGICLLKFRGGGGAPLRDKNGQILTSRKALISDMKYQHFNVNVDDDYHEVWNKGRGKAGLTNFINKNEQIMGNLNYQPFQGNLQTQNFVNRGGIAEQDQQKPRFNNMQRSQSGHPSRNNNMYIPNHMPMPMQHPVSNNFVPYYAPAMDDMNIMPQYNNTLGDMPIPMMNDNSNNNNFGSYPIPQQNNLNGNNNNPVNHFNNPLDISVSYKNHDVDGDNKRKMKEDYGRTLLDQMEEKKRI
jgi:hypothetical protein